jgi:hypothetical protein
MKRNSPALLCVSLLCLALAVSVRIAAQQTGSGQEPAAPAGKETPATDPKPPADETRGQEWLIIKIEHGQADDIVKILGQVYSGVPNARIAADHFLNQVVVRAPPQYLKDIRALVQELDRASRAEQNPTATRQVSKLGGGPLAGSAFGTEWKPANESRVAGQRNLRQEFEAKERQAFELAVQLRQLESTKRDQKDRDPRIEDLKKQLRQLVAESFALRRELQTAELAALQQRLVQAQVMIELRNRIQDQIIDRRVADLLNPALRWEPGSDPAMPETSTGTGTPARQLTPRSPAGSEQSRSASSELLQQLVKLAQEQRDQVRAMYQGGRTTLTEFLEAEQNLALRQLQLAEAQGNWSDAITRAEEFVKRSQEHVAAVKARVDSGVESTVELNRAQLALLEAELQLKTITERASESKRGSADTSRLPPAISSLIVGRSLDDVRGLLNKSPSDYAPEVRRLRGLINQWEAGKYGPDHPLRKQSDEYIASQRQQLEILTLEFRTQLKLLDSQVQAAKGELEHVLEEAQRARQLFEQGVMTESEYRARQARVRDAEQRLSQAEALRALYKASDESMFGTESAGTR